MDYIKGTAKCKQALIKLSTEGSLTKRIDNAFFEVSEINPNEMAVDNLKKVVEWCEEYISVRDKHILDGVENDKDKNNQLVALTEKLAFICIEIIEAKDKNSNN